MDKEKFRDNCKYTLVIVTVLLLGLFALNQGIKLFVSADSLINPCKVCYKINKDNEVGHCLDKFYGNRKKEMFSISPKEF